ncbi:MAG: oxidoreductase [Chloroflexota bacterium]
MEKKTSLFFCSPYQIELREDDICHPGAGQVLVKTIFSSISPGTEMLVYRGQFPDVQLDSSIPSLNTGFSYPLVYGYACVGRVIELGGGVDTSWQDRLVFSFQPHTSFFTCSPADLIIIPSGMSLKNACFLANMETAVNLLQDAAPLIGERVLVVGQGIVGLLTSALLSQFPLDCLFTVDRYPIRRSASLNAGAHASFDPADENFQVESSRYLQIGADLSFELTGNPAALNTAIDLTTFSGRIVIGSWYGEKQSAINLGGGFHRSRIKLISSQVSTIAPELSGRWDKSRRFETAWAALCKIEPQKWITQIIPIEKASDAYQLIDTRPGSVLQVILEY